MLKALTIAIASLLSTMPCAAEAQTRLFRAYGEHTCQSRQSLGHKCDVMGTSITDCNKAYYDLKRDDCCRRSKDGGVSINFKLTKCTQY
ncbi:hypothetical protein SAMN05216338_1002135 [Bradyrhizobium sp. Rc2d]|nr:hypothetical protein SAMN05216338_1002135 [Bradyrhizobium sp. Rc2d]